MSVVVAKAAAVGCVMMQWLSFYRSSSRVSLFRAVASCCAVWPSISMKRNGQTFQSNQSNKSNESNPSGALAFDRDLCNHRRPPREASCFDTITPLHTKKSSCTHSSPRSTFFLQQDWIVILNHQQRQRQQIIHSSNNKNKSTVTVTTVTHTHTHLHHKNNNVVLIIQHPQRYSRHFG
jgi:hypothetical protein